jgi:hypothetical protein
MPKPSKSKRKAGTTARRSKAPAKARAGKKPTRKAGPAQRQGARTGIKAPVRAAQPAVKVGPTPPGPAAKPQKAPAAHRPSGRKGGRRSSLALRRGPDGQPLQPGEILIPGGVQNADEVQYLLRGCVAAEHPNAPAGVEEILAKRGTAEGDRPELMQYAEGMVQRFDGGSIESLLPLRPQARRNFQGVVERAKHRRREIGAFLRGLDLGRTETSHMDSHGEASLQSLMEWAARLENLAEADEPGQADYAQFHRGLDQLDNTTEALLVDVELTLRRLRDRLRS